MYISYTGLENGNFFSMEIFVDVNMNNEQITRQIDQMMIEEATEAVREAPYFLKVKSGPAA